MPIVSVCILKLSKQLIFKESTRVNNYVALSNYFPFATNRIHYANIPKTIDNEADSYEQL